MASSTAPGPRAAHSARRRSVTTASDAAEQPSLSPSSTARIAVNSSRDPASLKDALERMERTMTGQKAHLAAGEARRWRAHIPALVDGAGNEEVDEIIDRLVRFRQLHASREAMRRKIEAQMRAETTAHRGKASRKPGGVPEGRHARRGQGSVPPDGRGLRPDADSAWRASEYDATNTARTAKEVSATVENGWGTRPQLA
ncbi:hypothetical protein AB1Y20_015899 [Prymnesium parvum]|uniref:Uncharacterized protein n=1 Tax=Prymnesium parvum TaxID=97485 RepID=A0AB34K292_PRYPA